MDEPTPGSGLFWGALIVIAVVACVWLGASFLTERITSNQATAAQAQAQIEREQTAQTRIVEDAHTERWQSFLVAMRGVQADVANQWPFVLTVLTLWLVVGVILWRDRQR